MIACWVSKNLVLLLSHISRVRLCVTPQTAAHQVPPSLGFSRQEHWSGLPFPSPVHESEKWKWSRPVVSDSLRPHGLQPTSLLRPWDFPGKSTGVGCHCLLPKNLKGTWNSLFKMPSLRRRRNRDSTKMTSFHQLTSKYNVEWCCSGQDTSSQEIILPRSFSEGLI